MRTELKRLLATLIFMVILANSALALPQGWFSTSIVSGTTNNLFADSTNIEDYYSSLNFVYEQPLTDNLLLYYDGLGEIYYKTSSLTNLDHNAGIEVGKYIKNRGEIFTGLSGFMLNYRDDYELFNRQGAGLKSGFRWISSPFVRWRSGVDLSYNDYPNDDTLAVSYSESYLYLGVNIATKQKIALDISPGLQFRRYSELDTPANTSYFWINSRISRPIGDKTGVSLGAMIREQVSVSGDAISALVQGGIDPGDLLWSGYNVNASLNYGKMPWFISFSTRLSQKKYTETFSVTGVDQRKDDVLELRLHGKYVLNVPNNWPNISVGTNLNYTNNESSDSYFTYDGFSASAYLVIRSR